MRNLLPTVFILNLVPSYIWAVKLHYPDFTCFQSYEKEGMEVHEKICSKRIKNPLNRDCYKACMLERLNIISPPDIYEGNASHFEVINLDPDTIEDSLAELKSIFYVDLEATEVASKIVKSCKAIIHKTINVEQKDCEAWAPVYDCVQQSLCTGDTFYPDMSCHDDYRSFPFRREKRTCDKKIGLPTTQNCMKGCLLMNLGIFVYDLDEEDPKPRMGSMDGEYAYYNLLYNFIDGLSGNRDLAEKVLLNMHKKCNQTFIRLVNVENRPCEEWTELYDCVEKALQCTDVNANTLPGAKPGGPPGSIILPPPGAPPALGPREEPASRRRRRQAFH